MGQVISSLGYSNCLLGQLYCKKSVSIADITDHFNSSSNRSYYKPSNFDELEAIKSIERKDNVILIDDLRIIKNSFPWGETSYGNINFLQEIKNTILSINKDYKFETLNGQIQDDVLMAYI